MIEQSPMAVGLLSGRDMIIDVGNEKIFEVWGKNASVTGLPLMQALPEIEGQGFLELLQTVFETGIPYFGNEKLVKLVREGETQDVYFDFVYTPLRDDNQQIFGVMILATEVTAQVSIKQKAFEVESTLREAIELAELGTWQTDFSTGMVNCSDRMKSWLGINEEGLISRETIYAAIRHSDQHQVQVAIAEAVNGKEGGLFDVEYSVNLTEHTKERILRARGKVFFDHKGIATKMVGATQDVTIQRQMELSLQKQVHSRTADLLSANQELTAINEEYVTANEELLHANRLLNTSNQSLQQFAYIASHDLQEPLRKIQSFGNLLQSRYGEQLGEGNNYVVRMQAAAERMSTLIADLLSFSDVNSTESQTESIALNEVVKNVMSDLELIVEKTHAIIQVDELPVIKGDRSQLEQLFQNLLSNALKFQQPGTIPLIQIDWKIIKKSELPENVIPVRNSSAYDRITITDNGIGFDEQYAKRIFQVFQRLHGKSEFAGTGIGLAICEKVVINHGGAIIASSQPGQGSIFSIYFPITG
jgi:signal transduction histidine kinase